MLPIVPGDRRRSEGSGETFGQFPIARGCARYGPGRDVYGLRGRSKGPPVDFKGTQRAQGPLAETNSVVASGSLSHSERTHRSHQNLALAAASGPGTVIGGGDGQLQAGKTALLWTTPTARIGKNDPLRNTGVVEMLRGA